VIVQPLRAIHQPVPTIGSSLLAIALPGARSSSPFAFIQLPLPVIDLPLRAIDQPPRAIELPPRINARLRVRGKSKSHAGGDRRASIRARASLRSSSNGIGFTRPSSRSRIRRSSSAENSGWTSTSTSSPEILALKGRPELADERGALHRRELESALQEIAGDFRHKRDATSRDGHAQGSGLRAEAGAVHALLRSKVVDWTTE